MVYQMTLVDLVCNQLFFEGIQSLDDLARFAELNPGRTFADFREAWNEEVERGYYHREDEIAKRLGEVITIKKGVLADE